MMMTEINEDAVTAVLITYRKHRHNHRLIFGAPICEVRRGWHRKFALFNAGQVFGYERWRGDKFGTQDWSLCVCKTVDRGPLTQVPGVMPGVKILVQARGKTKVKRTLLCIDALKNTAIALETQPEVVWRELHHRLLIGQNESQITSDLASFSSC